MRAMLESKLNKQEARMKPVRIEDPRVSLEEALEVAGGSQQKLANLLGVTRQTVHDWIRRKLKHLPDVHCYRWRKHYGEIERQGKSE